jgi:hypothetical protein
MSIRSVRLPRFDLIVFDSFEYNGQKRHKAHRVGTATASAKGGFALFIPAGIAITGRVLMVPEKTPLNEVDLLEAYQSAADAYGL